MAIGCFQTDERLLYVRGRQDIYWVRRVVSGGSIDSGTIHGFDDALVHIGS